MHPNGRSVLSQGMLSEAEMCCLDAHVPSSGSVVVKGAGGDGEGPRAWCFLNCELGTWCRSPGLVVGDPGFWEQETGTLLP